MDVRYINPFVRSISNTFETMCKLSVRIGKPALRPKEGDRTDVSGVIGFSGDAAGCIVLHFDFDVASKIATKFAGVDITPEHDDFADAIGELANMIAGGAKAQFEGLDISISLPNVIVGENHSVSASRIAPRVIIPCDTEVGQFHVEIGMEVARRTSAVPEAHAQGAVS